MTKSRKNRTSKALTEIFTFLWCVSMRKPKDEEDTKVQNHGKNGKMVVSENAAFFHEELNVSCFIDNSDGTSKHQQVYPEHLNPFANHINEEIIINIKETGGYDVVSEYPGHLNPFSNNHDYPEYLNPFSDDDDDDDDYPDHLNPFSGDDDDDDNDDDDK